MAPISPHPCGPSISHCHPAPPNTSTSGCEASDYAGVPAGAIILVQRGTCTFAQKFTLADASGAGAMVFINEGQAPDRTVPLWALRRDRHSDCRGDGRHRRHALERCAQWRHRAHREIQDRLASWHVRPRQRDRGRGAPRLGRVGPGINDNGSGSAVILEIAEQMFASCTTATCPTRCRRRAACRRVQRRSRRCSSTTSRSRACQRCRRLPTGAPTMGRSSRSASPRAACSPAPMMSVTGS
jgi:hypothetical protein